MDWRRSLDAGRLPAPALEALVHPATSPSLEPHPWSHGFHSSWRVGSVCQHGSAFNPKGFRETIPLAKLRRTSAAASTPVLSQEKFVPARHGRSHTLVMGGVWMPDCMN